jgi:hypothetical protein
MLTDKLERECHLGSKPEGYDSHLGDVNSVRRRPDTYPNRVSRSKPYFAYIGSPAEQFFNFYKYTRYQQHNTCCLYLDNRR